MDKNFNQDLLLSFIERIEKLNEEAENIAGAIREVFDEAKSAGYLKKYIREVIKLRKLNSDQIVEQDELTKLYRDAVGL